MATVPISDTETRNDYTATAAQTTFPYTFWIKEEDHLDVYVNGTLKTLTTDYIVSATQSVTGANVVFNSGLSASDAVAIVYNPDAERQTEFQTSGEFTATSLNLELSYLVSLAQWLKTNISRKLGLADTTNSSATLTVTPEASTVLGWNAAGDGFSNYSFGDISTSIDTALSSPAAGNLLQYNGTSWVNATTLTGNYTLSGNTTLSGTTTFTGPVKYADDGELTIATGAITVTGSNHTIDTEGGAASDDLDTISGGVDGMRLVLRIENDAREVVIKDGTGNIETPDGNDITLTDDENAAELIYDAALSKWLVLSTFASATPSATTTQAGVVEKATKAEMEAETSEKYPDAALVKNSPGVAKFWIKMDGTGTPAANDSYNISSITDNGTGDYTLNFTSNMGSAHYAVAGMCNGSGTSANQSGYIRAYGSTSGDAYAAASFRFNAVADSVSTMVYADFAAITVTGFGDLA